MDKVIFRVFMKQCGRITKTKSLKRKNTERFALPGIKIFYEVTVSYDSYWHNNRQTSM